MLCFLQINSSGRDFFTVWKFIEESKLSVDV